MVARLLHQSKTIHTLLAFLRQSVYVLHLIADATDNRPMR